MALKDFYPEIEPYNTFSLKVSDLHTIHVEEAGNPTGYPVVFLHGGPGGGISADYRRYFDPKFYRIVLFDQRGCGQSTPTAELRENTTWDLVSDIEKIRTHLKIDKWLVFGGSWGSTLALSYGTKHPDRISGFVLRGIFLCRPLELEWFYQKGASYIYPDYWDRYEKHIPVNERGNMITAYHKRLTSNNLDEQLAAAKVWSQWEAATSRLFINAEAVEEFEEPKKALEFARIECHYFINRTFFPTENYLLENVKVFQHIPGVIVQGRYDVVCPAKSAWDLKQVWHQADLKIVQDAGHAASEPGIRSALIDATDNFRSKLSK